LIIATTENPALAKWLGEQRFYKKKGKLTPERKAQLQGLVDQGKLAWNVKSANKNRWQKNFEELITYANEHGNCNVPQSYGRMICSHDHSMDVFLIRFGLLVESPTKIQASWNSSARARSTVADTCGCWSASLGQSWAWQ
jgi:hypothetical protein